ncbi:MAG: hypothetical protein LBD07_06505 [Spirochaetaceae bacterium]|jgi:phage host-nuclease inhibitor protein Gam|nr:hypothetical protein [Spirochaetaceae bacterium]
MDEQTILHHLFEVEKNASQIVEIAQKEAAALITENDRACRADFDADFTREYAALETDFNKQIQEIDDSYAKELERLSAELDQCKPDQERFNARMREFLLSEGGQPFNKA